MEIAPFQKIQIKLDIPKKKYLNYLMNGYVFHALAHADLKTTRPRFVFVPKELIVNGKLDREAYVAKRWASINCAANNTIGSHLFPDFNHQANVEEYGDFLKEVKRFMHKEKGTPSTARLPGKAGLETPDLP